MPISTSKPYKYVCPKCGFKIIIRPTDVKNPVEDICFKCGSKMVKYELDLVDKVLLRFNKSGLKF